MIKLVKNFKVDTETAEGIKIFETKECYDDLALFWEQKGSPLVISMLDRNMVISGKTNDYTELKEFLSLINPSSIFSSKEVLDGLNLTKKSLIVDVLRLENPRKTNEKSDELSSKDVYGILLSSGLEVGNYEYFAPDFCLRSNKGRLKYFGMKNKCAAVSIGTKNILINAVASLEKGFGTKCLNGLIMKNDAKTVLVCAKEEITPFYLRNGFIKKYEAGYWRK